MDNLRLLFSYGPARLPRVTVRLLENNQRPRIGQFEGDAVADLGLDKFVKLWVVGEATRVGVEAGLHIGGWIERPARLGR